MFYHEFQVQPELMTYIKTIWTLCSEAGSFLQPERLIPDGQIEVLLNFGDPYVRYLSDDFSDPLEFKGSQVVGQRPRYYFTAAKGRVDFISISFRPGGLSPFVR